MAAKEKKVDKKAAVAKTAKKEVKKKKVKLSSPKVLARIYSTYNNTIISITDYQGNVIATSSCGKVGFSGSKKSTQYAATKAGEDASVKAFGLGAREAEVIVK